MRTKGHRGRFQAQGGKIEKSEAWSQSEALKAIDGFSLLNQLEKQLTKREFEIRKEAFMKCRSFIHDASEKEGVSAPVRKSFPGNIPERVDLEVIKGLAFV